jgi:hypothetical protein
VVLRSLSTETDTAVLGRQGPIYMLAYMSIRRDGPAILLQLIVYFAIYC